MLKQLDRTGLSHWLLGFGAFLTLTVAAIIMLIVVRYPDPDMYRNSIAFTAISSFFLILYLAMGRGWHRDLLQFLSFDDNLEQEISVIEPGNRTIVVELLVAAVCVYANLQLNDRVNIWHSNLLLGGISFFFYVQWVLIVFSIDVVLRQLVCLVRIADKIRIDLLNAEFYSTLANAMVRLVGLYIFGLCILSLSYIAYTEGELGPSEMLLLMMPWYLPGLIIISLYIIPFNRFKARMHFKKVQELNAINAALAGNFKALENSLLLGEDHPSKIDLLTYRDRIRAIKEWPFTDRIRALVLFGILPPLTWVIAALIEILIEGAF
ncbi:MAG: hypothetical protein ACNYPE_05175 [Candidatus Azotimanducaceae bacterium WSBS_2022_MAG_OTU7]